MCTVMRAGTDTRSYLVLFARFLVSINQRLKLIETRSSFYCYLVFTKPHCGLLICLLMSPSMVIGLISLWWLLTQNNVLKAVGTGLIQPWFHIQHCVNLLLLLPSLVLVFQRNPPPPSLSPTLHFLSIASFISSPAMISGSDDDAIARPIRTIQPLLASWTHTPAHTMWTYAYSG